MTETPEGDRIYIGELAKVVDRRVNTVRGWCRAGWLPETLMPKREELANGTLGWRYWTSVQVAEIVAWMKKRNLYPGSGLVNFEPDAARIEEMIHRLRARKVPEE